MNQGIAIFGLNGGGKSTLAHALAKQTGYFEMDAEDYYFPGQSASRKWALENTNFVRGRLSCDKESSHSVGPSLPQEMAPSGELPFSDPRPKTEVESAILKDIEAHPKFILAGVTMNWCSEILSCIDIAFWVQTPLQERLRRIQAREEKRFGNRVLVGGDMFTQQMDFLRVVEKRDPKPVEKSVGKLSCPVVVLDGTISVTENLAKIIEHLNMTS